MCSIKDDPYLSLMSVSNCDDQSSGWHERPVRLPLCFHDLGCCLGCVQANLKYSTPHINIIEA
jgi:hypothetical protein